MTTIHEPRDCGCGGADHDECALANSYAAAHRIIAAGEDPVIARAEAIGRDAGIAAASWIFDGNTTVATCRHVLAGITDGDPMVLDAYRLPDLSGEFGDPTPGTLAIELDLDEKDDDDADTLAAACSAWEDAAGEAFWAEAERLARLMLGADEDDGAYYPGESDSSYGPLS